MPDSSEVQLREFTRKRRNTPSTLFDSGHSANSEEFITRENLLRGRHLRDGKSPRALMKRMLEYKTLKDGQASGELYLDVGA